MLAVLPLVLALPPNVSLDTLPVVYYGSSWPNKTDAQIDMLSKQRVVILMQEDGDCWVKCCPHQLHPPQPVSNNVGKC